MNNKRNRGGWSAKSLSKLETVKGIIENLKEYWPLTLRQVYYQLVASGNAENCRNQYSLLSRLLAKARIDGMVPWKALEDRGRALLLSDGWDDKTQFIDDELDDFLTGYRRNLLRAQEWVPELWIEKDALSRICYRVAEPYCVPVVVAKGFSSVSYVHDAAERILYRARRGQKTFICYFGDLDPSGREMLPSMMKTLVQEMGCVDLVDAKHYALTPDKVAKYNLPLNPDALKKGDSRAKKFVDEFRDMAVELDALNPATLSGIVEAAIRQHLDLSHFSDEQQREVDDRQELRVLRDRVNQFIIA